MQRGVDAWLIAERGGGLERDERFDLIGGPLDRPLQGRRRADRGPLRLRASTSACSRAKGTTSSRTCSSTNGTLLNGGALDGEAELVDGDTIQIGDTVFRFEAS